MRMRTRCGSCGPLNRNASTGCCRSRAPFPTNRTEFVEHYHGERNHQGSGNRLIESRGPNRSACPARRLLNYYERAASRRRTDTTGSADRRDITRYWSARNRRSGGGAVSPVDSAIKIDGTPLTRGYISIQAETAPTDFRKIDLLNLEGCMDPQASKYRRYFVKSNPAMCKN